jgi:uncharacterized membrane protein YphA (DoxX/SURF4 family)
MFQIMLFTLARFFISSVFLAGGVKNILHWHETETELLNVLSDWQSYVGFSQKTQIFFAMLIPWAPILESLATILLFAGGLSILLNIKEKVGTFFLILFLIPATILYHPFWWAEGVDYELQTVMFLKNLSILGCLFQMLLWNIAPKRLETDGFSPLEY